MGKQWAVNESDTAHVSSENLGQDIVTQHQKYPNNAGWRRVGWCTPEVNSKSRLSIGVSLMVTKGCQNDLTYGHYHVERKSVS